MHKKPKKSVTVYLQCVFFPKFIRQIKNNLLDSKRKRTSNEVAIPTTTVIRTTTKALSNFGKNQQMIITELSQKYVNLNKNHSK